MQMQFEDEVMQALTSFSTSSFVID